MSANEKLNGSVLGNGEYQNATNENAVEKVFYKIDDYAVRNDFTSNNPNPEQITNDEDDFLNSDYPEDEEDFDDEDLEEEAENPVDKPGNDFNEIEEEREDEDLEEDIDEDSDTEFPEDDPRRF